MTLEEAMQEFHHDNLHVYDLFIRFTNDVLRTGRAHYSAVAIFQRIRWHTDIETRSHDDFKINNNHAAYYSRMFMSDHPQHEGFFRTRQTQGMTREDEKLW